MTTTSADDRAPAPRPRVSVEELARRKGVRPIESLDDMARDVFASDDELDEFLTFFRSERQAGLA